MWQSLKVQFLRWYYRWANHRSWSKTDLSDVISTDISLAGDECDLRARMYQPQHDHERQLLIFMHGGGWVMGDLVTHDPFCRLLARHLSSTVIALDYRLAPEHRYPAAAEDCIAATHWILANRSRLKLKASNVVVVGDSAGGNLAAVVANQLARELPGQLNGQILICPVVRHYSHPTQSYVENGAGYGLTLSLVTWFWDTYLGKEPKPADGHAEAHATPLTAPIPTNTPPALVITAGRDPLRDEGVEYADLLLARGIECHHEMFHDEMHGFVCSEGDTSAHRQAMAVIANWTQSLTSP